MDDERTTADTNRSGDAAVPRARTPAHQPGSEDTAASAIAPGKAVKKAAPKKAAPKAASKKTASKKTAPKKAASAAPEQAAPEQAAPAKAAKAAKAAKKAAARPAVKKTTAGTVGPAQPGSGSATSTTPAGEAKPAQRSRKPHPAATRPSFLEPVPLPLPPSPPKPPPQTAAQDREETAAKVADAPEAPPTAVPEQVVPEQAAPEQAVPQSPAVPYAPAVPESPAVPDVPTGATDPLAATAAAEPESPAAAAPVAAVADEAEEAEEAGALPPAPAVTPEAWAAAAWAAVRHPDQPPEQLAALAVAEFGPRAAAWAQWLRQTYPTASADGIARLAARRSTRIGPPLTAVARAGRWLAFLPLPVTEWVRVTLVLRIAAAYGHDPADPGRATELVDLLGMARDQDRAGSFLPDLDRMVWQVGLLTTGRLLFGRGPAALALGALSAAADQGEQLERLAHRAVRYYRDQGPGSPSRSPNSA